MEDTAHADEEARRREEEMERLLMEQEAEEAAAAAAEEPPPEEEEEGAHGEEVANGEAEAAPAEVPAVNRRPREFFSYRKSSFAAFIGLLFYAMRTRRQYYLATVFLSSSKWAYVVMGNTVLAASLTLFDAAVKTFLNGLRIQEAEGLQDFFRWNVTETCLALTMFRSELSVVTVLHFVALITVKCLHHVGALREQHLRMTEEAVTESASGWPSLRDQHVNLLGFLFVLQMLDIWALQFTVTDLVTAFPSVSILFAFEAAIMLVSAWSHMLLWHLHLIDSLLAYGHERGVRITMRCFHPWKEYKATLQFAVELQAQAVQFLFYTTFFAIVLTYYGMPINLFREVYMSFAALKERLTAFLKYRQLMASMNRFKTGTDEELDEAGRICIICRDEMTTADCKRLPICHHLFHKSCLREWLVQQQSCPTCRSDISANEARERAQALQAQAAEQREQQEGEGEGQEQQQAADAGNGAPALPTGRREEEKRPPPQRQESSASEKKVRFLETPLLKGDVLQIPCSPALYRVIRAEGAPVWADGQKQKTTRTVPCGTLVICQGLELRKEENGKMTSLILIQIPDGWVAEEEVELVHMFPASRS
jgi:E3 ubiquitin-protein ligase synoviolin